MELLHLFWRAALEANGCAIGHCRKLLILGLGNGEKVALIAVKESGLASRPRETEWFSGTKQPQNLVVELFGSFQVVASYHYMAKHGASHWLTRECRTEA